MRNFLGRVKRPFLVLLFLASPFRAFAHDPGLSSAHLRLTAAQIQVVVTYNDRDISALLGEEPRAVRKGGQAIQEKLSALTPRVGQLLLDGREIRPSLQSAQVDQNQNVEFNYSYPNRPAREVVFRSLLIPEMPFGHRQSFVAVNSAGADLTRRLLSKSEASATFAPGAPEPPPTHSLADFFFLGVRHILTGYDHLLFLFGLLIVCQHWRQAVLLITCFTVAHSITLALATFGLVELPSRWVESAIAASILYVGVENLARSGGPLRGRWLLTFAFGLVHGLGFAGALREMGVAQSGWTTVIPLAGFNLGVEAGQLCVTAILLPLILHYRKRPRFLRLAVPACSLLVALAGGCWLIQRTLFG